ncbi:MAG: hypothetical protein QM756_24010 [Polyangiaceae bacterium]
MFSALDGFLIRYVRECLFFEHPDVGAKRSILSQGMHHWFDEQLCAWIAVRVDANLKPHLLDQLVFVDGKLAGFSGDPSSRTGAHERAQEMFTELSDYSSLGLSDLLVQGNVPPVGPAIIRSARNCYVLRGATQDAVDDLRELLKRGLRPPAAWASTETTSTKTPRLSMRLVVHYSSKSNAR